MLNACVEGRISTGSQASMNLRTGSQVSMNELPRVCDFHENGAHFVFAFPQSRRSHLRVHSFCCLVAFSVAALCSSLCSTALPPFRLSGAVVPVRTP